MKRLHYRRPNNLSKLHDELLAAVPELRPVPSAVPIAGLGEALVPVMQVEGLGDDIWLTVPDGVDEATINAVVKSHDPTPLPDRRKAAIEALKAATTVAELKQAVLDLVGPAEERGDG